MKKISVFVVILLALTGCFNKEYTFKVKDEIIFFEQTYDDFEIEMLEPYVSVSLGDKEVGLEVVELDGLVDLETVGTYEVNLFALNKKQRSEVALLINVVDTAEPEFLISENELLVYANEQVEINSEYFNMNLFDGINGLVNDRITYEGEIDTANDGLYPITLMGSDVSGNETAHKINFRVTDIIDEKALYLYKKAIQTAHGETLVFTDRKTNLEVLNFDQAFNTFTPAYRKHFLWLSGLNSEHNTSESGIKLSVELDSVYAEIIPSKDKETYLGTTLTIQNESEGYRHYLAKSTYKVNDEEVVKNFKFIIKEIDGVWLVHEFYMPY